MEPLRAIRNNNPGNLNAGEHWQGLMPPLAMTQEQRDEHRFAVFQTPVWGFRALCVVLQNYEHLYGLKTIRGIISRWAPPSENNTIAYMNDVAARLQLKIDDTLNLRDPGVLSELARAIAVHECGGWYFNLVDCFKGAQLAVLP